MKNKLKIITSLSIVLLVVSLLTTVVLTVSNLGVLDNTTTEHLGGTFVLSWNGSLKLKGSNLYCIQKHKALSKGGDINFLLDTYVEINGKEATVYDISGGSNVVIDNLNAEVAYILSKGSGYSIDNAGTISPEQKAFWHIANAWTQTIFGNNSYVWAGNDEVPRQRLNDEASDYANIIGNAKAPSVAGNSGSTSKPASLKVTDKTDKNNLSAKSTGDGYMRVGPFRWEFGGTLQSIIVNNGAVSGSNVRLVKYVGTNANIVNAADILTGEAFYVDIKGADRLTSLTLKTDSKAGDQDTIYTAKIWFFHSALYQNLVYAHTGDSPNEPSDGTGTSTYDIGLKLKMGIVKVDDRTGNTPLSNVGFQFSATIQTYDEVSTVDHGDWVESKYEWVNHTMYLDGSGKWSNTAHTYYTDSLGQISIDNITFPTKTITNEADGNGNKKSDYTSTAKLKENTYITATEVSNPHYGYMVGSKYTIRMNSDNEFEVQTITNHQKLVKLSGYVWLDGNDGKQTVRNDIFESGESGVNGIKVYLKTANGNIVKETTTSELGLYSEINGGEYIFEDVDLDALEAGNYHIEFEYCGITYQSVTAKINEEKGSKAIDTTTRNILDSKFGAVEGNGSQSVNINGVTVNYNSVNNYISTVNNHTGCEVYANTDEAGYNLYSGFTPTTEEIRYINLGLFEKAQTDFAISEDLYNVRVAVNGFSHIYRYANVRYNNDGSVNDESWNVGVKFQNNRGTYNRAIYKSDADYESPNHKDNEIKVYVTYKIAIRNEATYLGRINNIVNYTDNRTELIAVGTEIDNMDNVTGNIGFGQKTAYNNEYSKYIIETNSTINSGEAIYLYAQFMLDRTAVLAIMNNGDLINNVTEINSYTTFKDNNTSTPVSVIDIDSVPGNAIPGNVDTYEDDTDAARSLRLEFKNERDLKGVVFVDATGKNSDIVYKGEERIGNGILDSGETPLSGITVKLREAGKDDSSYDGERVEMETTTDANGEYQFTGYIPGNYNITYIWGDNTYKVQYYKGTIYDVSRKQNDPYWYRGSEYNNDTISKNIRKTDALDNYSIREKIDDEMEAVKINILENEINKAYNGGSSYIAQTTMESVTPIMSFNVEYETTITDGIADQVKYTVDNVDFGIVERPKQQLEFIKRISKYKITLANGQVLVDVEIAEDGTLKGAHDYTTYIKPVYIKTEMDTELIEGATLEITYEMKVTNVGELDYMSQQYYCYGTNKNPADLVKASVTGLVDYLDTRVSILDNKWEEKDNDYLISVNASEKDDMSYLNSNRIYWTNQLSKALAPGESNTVDLHVSKLLTSDEDNTINNKAEISEVTKTPGFSTGTPVKVTWIDDSFNFNISDAERVIIVPSTGENRDYVLPIVIGITTLISLGVGAFVIKKFVVG